MCTSLSLLMSFRAVLFRMVPKLYHFAWFGGDGFRAVLFRMVPKLTSFDTFNLDSFRAVLFRMVPKPSGKTI